MQHEATLTRNDLAIAGGISILLAPLFTWFSPGIALLVAGFAGVLVLTAGLTANVAALAAG